MKSSNDMRPLVLFAHGKESGPLGSKMKHLVNIAERHGAQVLSPDYSDLSDPQARVERLSNMELPAHNRLILVGSSMGGYVSCVVSGLLKPEGLFLMAPAFGLPGYAVQHPIPVAQHTCVVMGWQDEVVPVGGVIAFAKTHSTTLLLLDADHRLKTALPELGELFDQFLRRVLA
jgi:alpha/beta superfamily hydrolase